MSATKYLIDTNVFVRFQGGQQYDKECFPIHFKNFLKLLDNGIAISIDKVKDELDDEFFSKEYGKIFQQSITNDLSETYNHLRVKYPDYFNSYALENPNDADPYIVTFAFHNDLCIVTQDEFQSTSTRNLDLNKYNIPTLCDALGATVVDNKDKKENSGNYTEGFGCICLTELIKIEKLMH